MEFGQSHGTFFNPGVTGRPSGRTTRPKPFYAMHPNAPEIPQFLKSASELMKTYGNNELPPGLQPRWLLNKKNANISRGMTKGK
jgi:hypothetical protein